MPARLFDEDRSGLSRRHRALHGAYERALTLVEFLGALCFAIGSAGFFWAETQRAGVWLFLIGSLFLCASPVLRVLRQRHLARLSVDRK